MKAEKRDKIKNISTVSELIEVTENILTHSGFENIERINELSLKGDFLVPEIGTFTNLYYHTLQHLSRNTDQFDKFTDFVEKSINHRYAKLIIVSSQNITNGFKTKLEQKFRQTNFEFWTVTDLVEKIDNTYSNFWTHNDQKLVRYETEYKEKLDEINDIRKLISFRKSHEKLLSIFIKPKLFLKAKDKQSSRPSFVRKNIEDLIEYEGLTLINGEAGSGKTRLLKELSLKLIESNSTQTNKRYLPVFIYATHLNDNRNEDDKVDIKYLLNKFFKDHFEGTNYDDVIKTYNVCIFVDTVDEFDDDIQELLFNQFGDLLDEGIKIYLGTRNLSSEVIRIFDDLQTNELHLGKFDISQVEKFLTKYFYKNHSKARELLQSIRDNKIIEKLPITPLNLSLLSLLFEENNYEIPSTVTDIYTNFSNLLLGRANVDERFKFLDVTIKENILSAYAFKLLQLPNNQYLDKDEFISFIQGEFSNIAGTLELDKLDEALEFLIKNSGFLIYHEEKYVKFRHDSYMEYFAAKEIFQNKRSEEGLLVENFLDINWQFAAIFYGGFSRRMPDFLDLVIEKVKTANTFKDYISGIGGLGYLIQALYLTNDQKRKNAVLTSLGKVIEAYDLSKKVSSDSNYRILEKITVPVLALFNSFMFFENFNSITTKEPLRLAFDELFDTYKKHEGTDYPYLHNIGFKLFSIAWTLSSGRVERSDEMQKLVFQTNLVNIPFFELLFDMATEMSSLEEMNKLRGEIQGAKSKRKRNSSEHFLTSNTIDYYLKTPASRLRFSKYDLIVPEKKTKIITEGVTDAIILQHAFFVLSKTAPYWEVKPAHQENGGANELAKALNNGLPIISENVSIIGIFDNDSKGIQEFKGTLKDSKFEKIDPSKDGLCRLKKHKEAEIFGMLLPIPPDMQNFVFKEQDYNVFAIEHYFPKSFLEEKKMLDKHPIEGIYKIKDSRGKKKAFANEVAKINDIGLFENFVYLFKEIDRLFMKEDEIDYLI